MNIRVNKKCLWLIKFVETASRRERHVKDTKTTLIAKELWMANGEVERDNAVRERNLFFLFVIFSFYSSNLFNFMFHVYIYIHIYEK